MLTSVVRPLKGIPVEIVPRKNGRPPDRMASPEVPTHEVLPMPRIHAAFFIGLQLLLIASLSACGKKSTPTAPVDPNAGMYGTWNGTVTLDGGGILEDFPISIVLGSGRVAYSLDGDSIRAEFVSMQDPNVVFDVFDGSVSVRYTGTRTGDTLSGGGIWPGGGQEDSWSVTRSATPIPLRSATARSEPGDRASLGSSAEMIGAGY